MALSTLTYEGKERDRIVVGERENWTRKDLSIYKGEDCAFGKGVRTPDRAKAGGDKLRTRWGWSGATFSGTKDTYAFQLEGSR